MRSLLAAVLLVVSCSSALAQDLENLLTEAADSNQTKKVDGQKNKAETKKDRSPLVIAIYEMLDKRSSEQNIFVRFVESEEWSKALLQFPVAFEGTAFQSSANGRALLGYLQFRSGLVVTGIETLFQTSQPKSIHPELKKLWRETVGGDHPVWGVAKVNWIESWEPIFGINPGIKILSREVQNAEEIEKLKQLAERAPDSSLAQAEIDWQLVLAYSLNDQADKAGKILARLMKMESAPISKDLMNLTAARMLYQNGYFESAIKLYEKVSKTSDYWPESQEEIAWSYIRKGEPQNAMAVTTGLVKPSVASVVGPETYFVHSLSQLKVCNYTGVAESLDSFSKVFKKRTLELNDLVASNETKSIEKLLEVLKTRELTYKDVGNVGMRMPQLLTRDSKIIDFARTQKLLEDESLAAEKIFAQSLGQTGLQGSFEKLKNDVNQRAFKAKTASIQRIKDLAKIEVSETRDILKKMHIIEAEILQQTMVADKIAKNAGTAAEKNGSTGDKGDDVLKFPNESEFWFDEISKYKIDVKKPCVSKR